MRAAGARAGRRGTGLGHREARGQGRGSARRSEKFPGSSPRDAAREAAGGTMNVFRILGDLSHLLAMFLLLVKIWRSKSCAGERLPGGAGRDQGGNSGSGGTARARAHPKTLVKLFHKWERDFRFHGYYYRTFLAPSFTPRWQCHCYWTKTGAGGGQTLPLTRREERIFRKCPSGGVFPLPSTPQGGPSVSCMLVTPAWRGGVELALSGDMSYWRGFLFGQRSGCLVAFTGVGRSFQAG